MSDVGHWKKDGTDEARKQAEVAAAAREVASAERRAAGLQAALELGRLVRAGRVKAGTPDESVRALVQTVEAGIFDGADPGPDAAPWSPPGLPIPRLWAGVEAPFAHLAPPDFHGNQVDWTWDTAVLNTIHSHLPVLQPLIRQAVLAELDQRSPELEIWTDVVGSLPLEPALEPAPKPALEAAWVGPPSEGPPVEGHAASPQKKKQDPTPTGWLRGLVQGWLTKALDVRAPVRGEAVTLLGAIREYADDLFRWVPRQDWAAFVAGNEGDPLGPVSHLVWRLAEHEARFWRAMRRALHGPKGVANYEGTCCNHSITNEFCFDPRKEFEDRSPILLPMKHSPQAWIDHTLELHDAVAHRFQSGLGARAEQARRTFTRAYFGPGLGEQLNTFGTLPPEHRHLVMAALVASLDTRRDRIEFSPSGVGSIDGRINQLAGHATGPSKEPVALPGLGCCPEDDTTVGTVTIFGGGIAGLTAAHELAERGFAVQVVEAVHGPKLTSVPLVGGMARTQWAVKAETDTCCGPCEEANKQLVSAGDYRLQAGVPFPGQLAASFDSDPTHALGLKVPLETLPNFGLGLPLLTRFAVQVHAPAAGLPDDPGQVTDTLRLLAGGLALTTTYSLSAARLADQRLRSVQYTVDVPDCGRCGTTPTTGGDGLVALVLECGVLPGEHGYRFFPSFYRHLFDTMGRTPLYTGDGHESRHTTLDNLVSTYQQVLAGTETSSIFTRDRPASFEAFRREYVAMLEKLGFEKRDITRLMFRMFRFLTTSSDRRAADFEDISWWDFLVGATREDRTPRWTYSEAFEHHLKASPQALVGVDATWGDARTQGNITLQLLLDQFSPGGPTDRTLNGPTSLAWLELWRLHLQTLGVKFFAGTLKALCPPDCPPRYGQPPTSERELLTPCIEWPEGTPPDCYCDRTNYYLVATDVVSAEEVTRPLRTHLREHGVPGDLNGYTTRVPWNGPSLLPKRYFRLVVADRLPADHFNDGIDPLKMRKNRVTPTEHLPLVVDRVAQAQNRLRQLNKRLIGQIQTVILRNRPGESRVARIVIESTDTAAELQKDIEAVLQARTYNASTATVTEQIAYWSVTDLSPEQKVDFSRVLIFEEPEDDRLPEQDDFKTVVRRGHRYGEIPQDRLQTFSGIQYYFDQDLKVARGHVFFHETEWGLSSISQLQFWQARRSLRDQGIRGILSVDIGDWRTPSRYLGKAALDCSAREIADEVWRQIAESLRRGSRFGSRAETLPIPQPRYWYLDSALRFGYLDEKRREPTDRVVCIETVNDPCSTLIGNQMPFLVNNVSDWKHRPGAAPMDPDDLSPTDRRDEPFIWQADHGGYQVHFGQLLFAGTYLRTFTRMTTMEAANESARHAVNALLDHATAFGRRSWTTDSRTSQTTLLPPQSAQSKDSPPDLRSADQKKCRLDAHDLPLPVLAIAGDYCDIWDPEKHELDELAFFKRVDELLFQMGKPHLADILGIDALADMMHPESSSPGALLAAVIDTLRRDFAVGTEELIAGAGPLEEAIKGLKEKAKSLLGRLVPAAKA